MPADFDASPSKRALEALGDDAVREGLLKFGCLLTHSDAAAEDLLCEAVECVCDPTEGRPWDAARGSFETHIRIVMADLAKRARRRWMTRHETLSPDKVRRASGHGQPADERLDEARKLARFRRMADALRERLASRPLALQVLDTRSAGVERADELARLLTRTVEEIYDANSQIAYHARRVLAEEQAAEERELSERRGKARARTERGP